MERQPTSSPLSALPEFYASMSQQVFSPSDVPYPPPPHDKGSGMGHLQPSNRARESCRGPGDDLFSYRHAILDQGRTSTILKAHAVSGQPPPPHRSPRGMTFKMDKMTLPPLSPLSPANTATFRTQRKLRALPAWQAREDTPYPSPPPPPSPLSLSSSQVEESALGWETLTIPTTRVCLTH